MKKQRVRFTCKECEDEIGAHVFPGALVSCPGCKSVYLVGLDGDTYSIKQKNPPPGEKETK